MTAFSWPRLVAVLRRELNDYFYLPIGYVFLLAFALLVNFSFFFLWNFFDRGRLTLESLFTIIQFGYILLVPAVTMRLWAEERSSGTLELLLCRPFHALELVLGKYLAALCFLLQAVLLTMLIVGVLLLMFADEPRCFDPGVLAASLLGALLLGATYLALGISVSWLASDQIVAFVTTLVACSVFYLLGFQPLLQLLGPFKSVAALLSASWHYRAFTVGVIDTRDVFYFVSATGLLLHLNYTSIVRARA